MDALSPGFKGRGACPLCRSDASYSVGEKKGRLTCTCTACQSQTFARGPKSHAQLAALITTPTAAPAPPGAKPAAKAATKAPAAPAPAPAPATGGGWGFFGRRAG